MRTLKYKKGDIDPVPCQGCAETDKVCYIVAKSNVSVCWECKVSGKKCSKAKNRKHSQGMFVTSQSHFLLTESYSRRRLRTAHSRDLEQNAVGAAKT